MFRLSSCNDNVRGHLESLHISGEIVSEVELFRVICRRTFAPQEIRALPLKMGAIFLGISPQGGEYPSNMAPPFRNFAPPPYKF
jgi:hypothetical protein